jgi:hypothetical protein
MWLGSTCDILVVGREDEVSSIFSGKLSRDGRQGLTRGSLAAMVKSEGQGVELGGKATLCLGSDTAFPSLSFEKA